MRMESAVCRHGFMYIKNEFKSRSNKFRKWSCGGIVQRPRRNHEFGFSRVRVRKQFLVALRMKGVNVKDDVGVEKLSIGNFEVLKGSALPFGATAVDGGVNFAIYSSNSVSASICLMSKTDLLQVR